MSNSSIEMLLDYVLRLEEEVQDLQIYSGYVV